MTAFSQYACAFTKISSCSTEERGRAIFTSGKRNYIYSKKDNDGKSPQHPEDGDGNDGRLPMHNPKTGDSLMLGLWTILAGGAAGGLIWSLKKKNKC